MSSDRSSCGFSGCGQPVDANPVPCPDCLDVPVDNLLGVTSSHHYCSPEHLSTVKDNHAQRCAARVLWRSMVRIGALCDKVFMVYRMNLFPCHMTEAGQDLQENLEALLKPIGVVGQILYTQGEISHNHLLGTLSFDQCRLSIALLTPLLIWLTKDMPLRIQEISLVPKPKEGRPWLYFKLNRSYKFAKWHTALILTSTSSLPPEYTSLTLDPTSEQYSRRVKGHQTTQYMAERAWQEQPKSQAFGNTYKEWWQTGCTRRETIPEDNEFLFTFIAMAKMNEVTWQQVHQVGSRKTVFAKSHDNFVASLWETLSRVDKGLKQLRPQVQLIRGTNSQLNYNLSQMLANPGHGHKAMVAVMNEVL